LAAKTSDFCLLLWTDAEISATGPKAVTLCLEGNALQTPCRVQYTQG